MRAALAGSRRAHSRKERSVRGAELGIVGSRLCQPTGSRWGRHGPHRRRDRPGRHLPRSTPGTTRSRPVTAASTTRNTGNGMAVFRTALDVDERSGDGTFGVAIVRTHHREVTNTPTPREAHRAVADSSSRARPYPHSLSAAHAGRAGFHDRVRRRNRNTPSVSASHHQSDDQAPINGHCGDCQHGARCKLCECHGTTTADEQRWGKDRPDVCLSISGARCGPNRWRTRRRPGRMSATPRRHMG